MGRKWILTLLLVSLVASAFADDLEEPTRCCRGEAAGHASRDATVLSMMGWGIGIAIGIAVLCALLEDNHADTTTTTTTTK